MANNSVNKSVVYSRLSRILHCTTQLSAYLTYIRTTSPCSAAVLYKLLPETIINFYLTLTWYNKFINVLYQILYQMHSQLFTICHRLRLKCEGTCAATRFLLSAKRTSPFESAGASVQSITGSRGVRISGSNTPCSEAVWRVLATRSIRQFPLHFPSSALPCAITFQLDSNTGKQFLGR
jgi:hypothetical protein